MRSPYVAVHAIGIQLGGKVWKDDLCTEKVTQTVFSPSEYIIDLCCCCCCLKWTGHSLWCWRRCLHHCHSTNTHHHSQGQYCQEYCKFYDDWKKYCKVYDWKLGIFYKYCMQSCCSAICMVPYVLERFFIYGTITFLTLYSISTCMYFSLNFCVLFKMWNRLNYREMKLVSGWRAHQCLSQHEVNFTLITVFTLLYA